jgi:hypothetical protein
LLKWYAHWLPRRGTVMMQPIRGKAADQVTSD